MCGPLVASSSLHSASRRPAGSPDSLTPLMLYHAGRLLTYSIVGALMGLAGSFVEVAARLAGIQNGVMIAAGIIMTVMGLSILGVVNGMGRLERRNTLVLATAKKFFSGSSVMRFFPLGLVLGLLPCGLSYTVFIAAAGTGAPLPGMFIGLCFGVGTVPALALFSAVVSYLGSRMRARMQKTGGIIVLVMGLYYVLKGIRLYVEM